MEQLHEINIDQQFRDHTARESMEIGLVLMNKRTKAHTPWN